MGLEATASLLIAAFELGVVRSIRDAIRTADLASGKGLSATPLGPDPSPDIAPRRHVVPTPVYEPRVHLHPRPAAQYDTVHYGVEPAGGCGGGNFPPASGRATGDAAVSAEVAASAGALNRLDLPTDTALPARERAIPPVWAVLPPVEPEVPAKRPVKRIHRFSDTRCKGLVVDVHV